MSRESTQIAFVSDQPGRKQVFLMEANGANRRAVTRNRSINLFPGWSADGTSLVYTSYKTGRPEIWVIYRGTRPGDRLLRSGDEQLRAVWSKQSGLGALVLNRGGNTDIYALRGQRMERLTNHPDQLERFPLPVVAAADTFFNALQSHTGWFDFAGTTKTAFGYSVGL